MARTLSIGLVLLVSLLVACGSDDDDDDGNNGGASESGSGAPDTASPTAASSGSSGGGGAAPAPSGSGSGSLTVDGKTFEFSLIFCGFTPEETRNANVPFSMRGKGMDEGQGFSVDGSIVNLSVGGGTSSSHDLEVWYDDDPGNPIYRSGVPGSPARPEYVINDKDVSLEAEFSDGEGTSVGPGSLQATCP
jgi:hypothetical protein